MEEEIRKREQKMEQERLAVLEWERKQALKAAGNLKSSSSSSSSSSSQEEKASDKAATEAEERLMKAEEERLARIIAKGKK